LISQARAPVIGKQYPGMKLVVLKRWVRLLTSEVAQSSNTVCFGTKENHVLGGEQKATLGTTFWIESSD